MTDFSQYNIRFHLKSKRGMFTLTSIDLPNRKIFYSTKRGDIQEVSIHDFHKLSGNQYLDHISDIVRELKSDIKEAQAPYKKAQFYNHMRIESLNQMSDIELTAYFTNGYKRRYNHV